MKLFIVHGWAYGIEPWQRTVEILRRHNVEVVQLKVPGLTSPSDKAWTIDGYVEWLATELKNEPNPIVLGHSNGGRIAMHFDTKYPGRLARLILLNSAGIELSSSKLSLKRKTLALASKILAPLKKIPGVRKIVYRLLKSDYGNAPSNMKQTLQNMLASDKDFDVSKISAETDILWGENDTTTPLAMGKMLHLGITGSTFRMVRNWEHAPYRTHPEELAEEIIKMLKGSV